MRSSTAARAYADAAPVFAALGDETRLRLVSKLCSDGPQSTTQLSADARITRQAITKHLSALSAAGLVHDTRSGRERIWQLRPRRIEEARHYLDGISAQWDRALERLRRFVEEE